MHIEEEPFKRAHVNFEKLEKYGFKKEKDQYTFSKLFKNGDFRAEITVNNHGQISGKVIDVQIDDEYTNIKLDTDDSSFVNSVRESYKDILKDIRKNCFSTDFFLSDQANRITSYIIKKYGDEPEFLWKNSPGHGVFRNKNNDKWYGLIMNIDRSKITSGIGEIEILDLKADETKIDKFLERKGFYKGYHMNKKKWLTIILDDTIKDDEIIELIDYSYCLVNEK